MDEFIKAVAALLDTTPAEPIEYRLHYNELGEIYLCTMQQHPTDTQYVVVDKEIYDRYYDYYISEGVLKKIDRNHGYRVQLKKSDSGFKTVKNHAGIILDENETYSNIEYYANN